MRLLNVDYATCEYFLAAAQLVLATVGMGVGLRPRDFAQVLRSPRALGLVFVVQLALTPPLALGLALAFRLPSGFALGMVLMAAMPVGAMAAIFVYMGRGSAALSLAATGLSTLASLGTTTAVLRVFGSAQLPRDFEMPLAHMLVEFGVYLLLPLAGAMMLTRFAPARSPMVGKWCVRGSFVTLTTLIIGSFASGRLHVAAYGWRPPSAISALAAATFLLCLVFGRLAKLPASDSFTVGVLTTIRNGNLGLLLKASLFADLASTTPTANAVLYVVLFYSGASLVVSGTAALVRRKAAVPASAGALASS
jgi:bile acid:Na+ symporter, BASS family